MVRIDRVIISEPFFKKMAGYEEQARFLVAKYGTAKGHFSVAQTSQKTSYFNFVNIESLMIIVGLIIFALIIFLLLRDISRARKRERIEKENYLAGRAHYGVN